MNMIGFSGVIYRTICNGMSVYDTYRHTHCSVLFTAFICSVNNEKYV